jgi:Tol biopolymer transport system component
MRRRRGTAGNRSQHEGPILRRSIRAAAILAAICMVLTAGLAGTAARAQTGGTALLLSSSPSTYRLDPATGQRSVLVADGEDAVISPDRTRVAYVRDLDRDLCLYCDPLGSCWAFDDLLTADVSGTNERAVAHTADMIHRYSPDWSPKGSRILFTWWTLTKATVWPGCARMAPAWRPLSCMRVGGSSRPTAARSPMCATATSS